MSQHIEDRLRVRREQLSYFGETHLIEHIVGLERDRHYAEEEIARLRECLAAHNRRNWWQRLFDVWPTESHQQFSSEKP